MKKNETPIITLTTDWKSIDYYLGAIKGKILSQCPNATIVDINHQIDSYSINKAAFVLKHSYPHFPKGSIHIIGVRSESSKNKAYVVVKYDEHYFISVDNGIFNLLMDKDADNIIEIKQIDNIGSFPELNIFADTAAKIANKTNINTLGKKKENLFKLLRINPVVEESVISAHIVYVDSYGNVISNVTRQLFEEARKDRTFTIFAQSMANKITKINKSYNQSSEGELLAIFNSTNHLEIAIRNGNASQLLSLDTKSNIRIVFEDKKEIVNGKLF